MPQSFFIDVKVEDLDYTSRQGGRRVPGCTGLYRMFVWLGFLQNCSFVHTLGFDQQEFLFILSQDFIIPILSLIPSRKVVPFNQSDPKLSFNSPSAQVEPKTAPINQNEFAQLQCKVSTHWLSILGPAVDM